MAEDERDATDVTPASGSAAPPPAIPPPLTPTPQATISAPVASEAGYLPVGEPEPAPKKRRAFGVSIALIAGLLGFVVFKFVLPLVLVGVAGQALGLVFGGPFERLPGDVKQDIEQRFEAAVGNQLEGLSDDAQLARVDGLVKGGMPRLDDAALVSHLQLASSAFQHAETAACADVARAIVAGQDPPTDANVKVIGALSDAELRQWFELQILAIEAESRGSPAATVVSGVDMDSYFEAVFQQLSAADLEAINTLSNGATVDDATACSAVRGFYGAIVNRPPAEVALFARYDVSP